MVGVFHKDAWLHLALLSVQSVKYILLANAIVGKHNKLFVSGKKVVYGIRTSGQ